MHDQSFAWYCLQNCKHPSVSFIFNLSWFHGNPTCPGQKLPLRNKGSTKVNHHCPLKPRVCQGVATGWGALNDCLKTNTTNAPLILMQLPFPRLQGHFLAICTADDGSYLSATTYLEAIYLLSQSIKKSHKVQKVQCNVISI